MIISNDTSELELQLKPVGDLYYVDHGYDFNEECAYTYGDVFQIRDNLKKIAPGAPNLPKKESTGDETGPSKIVPSSALSSLESHKRSVQGLMKLFYGKDAEKN
jgi:hypothetical protein